MHSLHLLGPDVSIFLSEKMGFKSRRCLCGNPRQVEIEGDDLRESELLCCDPGPLCRASVEVC
jgi:hypothetical protein